ncbi:squalene synthase HpnC, partial [Saccharomonospora saliphila]|uniref:squalene synthase HpnC n=1 Tax=Saccharomonospora saliphila TaxID=369829 RepID=UPI00066277D6
MHADRAQLSPPARRLQARARQENFPVALRVLPARYRRHLFAVYAFARTVDDLGDAADGDRLALLDEADRELDRVFGGADPRTPVFRSLAGTVGALALPRQPFDDLVEANRRDQTVRRYRTFDDLLDYCALSAAPVGRLVLAVFGASSASRVRLSDRVCAALQVLEHCQDVVEDARADRIYLPADDLARFGVAERDLLAPRATTAVRALVALQTQRAVRLLDEGSPLVDDLSG